MTLKNEEYIGDGLYAGYDGFALWLRAPRVRGDGTPEDHVCALEPITMRNFIEYAMRVERHAKTIRDAVKQAQTNEQ